MKAGYEALCEAVLIQARDDHETWTKALNNPRTPCDARNEAERGLREIERSFRSGGMDAFTAFCPGLDGEDVYRAITAASGRRAAI